MVIKPIIFFVGCVLATYAEAQSAHPSLFAALRQGETAKVEQIIHTKSVSSQIAGIARAQLKYNIPRLLDLARKCERISVGRPRAMKDASYCNLLALDAADALGNAHAFASEELWRRIYVIPHLKKLQGHKPSAIGGPLLHVPIADLKKIASNSPDVTLKWQAGYTSVPVDHADAFSTTEPKIYIHINGHSVEARIDTRLPAPYPIIVVLSRSDIEQDGSKLGLVPLVSLASIHQPHQSEPANKSGLSMLHPEIANTIVVGPLVFRNLMIGLINSNQISPGIYLETPLLRRFGEVTLRKNVVIFSKYNIGSCKSGAEMTFASGKNLDGHMVFPVTVEGHGYKAAFWSGNPTALQITNDVFPAVASSVARGGPGSRVRQGPIAITVGAHTYRAKDAMVVTGSGGSFDVLLGNPILQSVDVHLVFDRPSPMICLSKANQ